MKKLSLFLSILLLFTTITTGCTKQNVGSENKLEDSSAESVELIDEKSLTFLEEFSDIVEVPYSPKTIEPNVPEYSIEKDLTNVSNLPVFGEFTEEQRVALATNGFFITPSRTDF